MPRNIVVEGRFPTLPENVQGRGIAGPLTSMQWGGAGIELVTGAVGLCFGRALRRYLEGVGTSLCQVVEPQKR